MNENIKGLICCDIDGTLIHNLQPIPEKTQKYFLTLSKSGWQLLFVTGRTYLFAKSIFKDRFESFYLASFNGALLHKMPEEVLLEAYYLPKEILSDVKEFVSGYNCACAFYCGREESDRSYLYSEESDSRLIAHLQKRADRIQENWQKISSYELLIDKPIIAIRCFLSEKDALILVEKFHHYPLVHAPKMRDSTSNDFCVVQITSALATKKQAMRTTSALVKNSGLCIACGDDYNDLSMLEDADISIVMQDAPITLHQHADIIAQSAKEEGLIKALDIVLKR